MSDEELTPEMKRQIDSLPHELAPPPELEEQVVGALRRRGLLRHANRQPAPWLRAVAAGLALLISGLVIGRVTAPEGHEAPGHRFLLMLYQGAPGVALEGEDEAQRVQEYGQWAAELAREGRLEIAEKLASTGRVVLPGQGDAGDGGHVIVETRRADPSDGEISGFFLIEAGSYDEAVRVAESSPHVRYGGRVAIREIDPT
jgi:hypothetical protein